MEENRVFVAGFRSDMRNFGQVHFQASDSFKSRGQHASFE